MGFCECGADFVRHLVFLNTSVLLQGALSQTFTGSVFPTVCLTAGHLNNSLTDRCVFNSFHLVRSVDVRCVLTEADFNEGSER